MLRTNMRHWKIGLLYHLIREMHFPVCNRLNICVWGSCWSPVSTDLWLTKECHQAELIYFIVHSITPKWGPVGGRTLSEECCPRSPRRQDLSWCCSPSGTQRTAPLEQLCHELRSHECKRMNRFVCLHDLMQDFQQTGKLRHIYLYSPQKKNLRDYKHVLP